MPKGYAKKGKGGEGSTVKESQGEKFEEKAKNGPASRVPGGQMKPGEKVKTGPPSGAPRDMEEKKGDKRVGQKRGGERMSNTEDEAGDTGPSVTPKKVSKMRPALNAHPTDIQTIPSVVAAKLPDPTARPAAASLDASLSVDNSDEDTISPYEPQAAKDVIDLPKNTFVLPKDPAELSRYRAEFYSKKQATSGSLAEATSEGGTLDGDSSLVKNLREADEADNTPANPPSMPEGQ